MKYCQHCGTQLLDEAKFCSNCGKATTQFNEQKNEQTYNPTAKQALIIKLSSRLKTNGIIWIVIASIQILTGLFISWPTAIIGVLNIVSAITDIKNSNRVLINQTGIVKAYESLVNPIITLVYNLVIGGVIGVAGSIYYLIFIRGFIMENKVQFLEMETNDNGNDTNNAIPQNENCIYTSITLTEYEALVGVKKEIFIDEIQKALTVYIPKKIKSGDKLVLKNVKTPTKDGTFVKKTIFVNITIP